MSEKMLDLYEIAGKGPGLCCVLLKHVGYIAQSFTSKVIEPVVRRSQILMTF